MDDCKSSSPESRDEGGHMQCLHTRPHLRSPPTEHKSLNSPQLLEESLQGAPATPSGSHRGGATLTQTPPPTSGGALSLSSPELLQELKQSRYLRHVRPQSALTTVFSGKGRMVQNPVHLSCPASQFQTVTPTNGRAEEEEAC